MTRYRALIIATSSACLLAVALSESRAQKPETDSAKAVRHDKEAADLAKAAQNPIANMVTLPLQYNYYTGGGLGSTSAMILYVQPVLPLEISKEWLLIARTIVPFTSVPVPLALPQPLLLSDTAARRGSPTFKSRHTSRQRSRAR